MLRNICNGVASLRHPISTAVNQARRALQDVASKTKNIGPAMMELVQGASVEQLQVYTRIIKQIYRAEQSTQPSETLPAAFSRQNDTLYGTPEYYLQRILDFVKRNPGQLAPSYYLDYGFKYCSKFSNLAAGTLSAAGLKWRDATLLLLQEAIEAKRAEDPEAFAKLELNEEAFTRFAFATHPECYIEGGIFSLPPEDVLHITETVNLNDWLSPEGRGQLLQFLMDSRPNNLLSLFKALNTDLRSRFTHIFRHVLGFDRLTQHIHDPQSSAGFILPPAKNEKVVDWNHSNFSRGPSV